MSILKNRPKEMYILALAVTCIMGCGESDSSVHEFAAAYAALAENEEPADSLLDYPVNWLSAMDAGRGTNDLTVSSSVCGWVLLNNLDKSLMVFNREGTFLGSIDFRGIWRYPPEKGSFSSDPPDNMNTHLRQLVNWVIHNAAAEDRFIDTFFENLNNAIEKMEVSQVQNSQYFNGNGLLMSRPLALVRASVKKETLLRLKDHPKLNEGLVALWIEDRLNQNYWNDTYYTPVDPKSFTMQVSSSKEIDIQVSMLRVSPDLYKDIADSFEFMFATSPLLSNNESAGIHLPEGQDNKWSWVGQEKKDWSEQTAAGHLSKKELEIFFPKQADILWARLIENKSLTALEGDHALITLSKSISPLSEVAPDLSPKLEEYLRNRQMNQLTDQEWKEGWLNLSKKSKKNQE